MIYFESRKTGREGSAVFWRGVCSIGQNTCEKEKKCPIELGNKNLPARL